MAISPMPLKAANKTYCVHCNTLSRNAGFPSEFGFWGTLPLWPNAPPNPKNFYIVSKSLCEQFDCHVHGFGLGCLQQSFVTR